jgi:hypothetical protein
MAWRVMTEKKHSTRLSQEQDVGVKCRVIQGSWPATPATWYSNLCALRLLDGRTHTRRAAPGDREQDALLVHPARTSIQDHGPCAVDSSAGSDCRLALRCWKCRRWGGEGLRGKPGSRRKFALLLIWVALLVVVGGGTALWSSLVWTSLNVGDVFSLATLVMTFLAAAVALLAYQVSTGLPDLILIIWFQDEEPDSHNIHIKTTARRWAELGNWFDAKNHHPTPVLKEDVDGSAKVAYISIYNRSRYAARNPAVIFRFGDPKVLTLGLCKSWKTRDDLLWKDISLTRSGTFVVETQWDGGYPIHGLSSRRLPDLPLETLYSTDPERKPVEFEVDLLADGYRQIQRITLNFKVEPAPDTAAHSEAT